MSDDEADNDNYQTNNDDNNKEMKMIMIATKQTSSILTKNYKSLITYASVYMMYKILLN